jgi:hypothetical protein
MEIRIVREIVPKAELAAIAETQFGDFVKAVVDVDQGIMAIGGELHADEEAVLLDHGSRQENLWGINLYLHKSAAEWIEFDSLINVRPSQQNRSRDVQDLQLRERIRVIVTRLVGT